MKVLRLLGSTSIQNNKSSDYTNLEYKIRIITVMLLKLRIE